MGLGHGGNQYNVEKGELNVAQKGIATIYQHTP
jgi:hypothetical protein